MEVLEENWFVDAMIEQIEWELSRKKYANKWILFRIHESGDFHTIEYLEKWVKIANHFKGQKIRFMAYTKSLPLLKIAFKNHGGKENINITFKSSVWDDTKEKFVNMTKELGLSVFTAVPKKELQQKGYFPCPSSENAKKPLNCGECVALTGGCYFMERDTAIEIH
jgi:hypothetical protein